MSSDRVPSRTEVMGWSPAQLAAHLKKMNLTGCDKVVLKNSISGSRFVNLSENDLQKFPKLHAPLISKISTEISKKEERRGLFGSRITTKYHEPAETSSDFQGGWDPDEFDDEDCDDDYESPYSGEEEGSGGDYESPNEDEYEPNPTEPPEDLPPGRLANLQIGDGDYIDKLNNHVSPRDPPPVVSPRPPVGHLAPPEPRLPGMSSSRRDASPSPHSASRPPGIPVAPPQISRENKPGRVPGFTSPVRGPQHSVPSTHPWRQKPDPPDPSSWTKPPVPPLPSSSVVRSNSSARVHPRRFDASREPTNDEVPKNNTFPLINKNLPPRPGPPSRHGDSLPPNVGPLPHNFPSVMDPGGGFSGSARQSFRPPPPTSGRTPELDPRWYVGKVTRGRAEECLKRVNKDGAYLVRDSARQLADQPFTLMVLYQDKVFNIQIRQQNQNFLLGTGLKAQESFPSVSDIISHYSQSPLLLIDAKNRRSPQQNQCLLSDPAGLCMTSQNWS